jgi:capping protein (actin filament) muscle Z-line, alpha
VQLEAKHKGSLTLPSTISADSPAPSATKLLALIKEFEGGYQDSLSDTYHEMGEKSFKSLRRALPLTRQKLDWDRVRSIHLTALFFFSCCSYLSSHQVLGYKLGQELSGAKGSAS